MDQKSESEVARAVAILAEQREALQATSATFAVYLLDLVLLELRRQLHRISDAELEQFVSTMQEQLTPDAGPEMPVGHVFNEPAIKFRGI